MKNIKILSIIEATTLTGPAKVLLEFYQSARDVESLAIDAPQVETSIVTFHRQRDGATLLSPDEAPNHFVEVARSAGLKVDVVPERFRFDTRVIHNIRRLVEQYEPDIIETHHVKSHFLLRSSGLWKQRPWVAYHHGYTMTDFKMHAYNQLDRWSLRAANRIITVSRASARGLERIGVPATRIRALHNAITPDWHHGINAEDVETLRHKLGIAPDERVVLAVGRLSKEKAQADLVTAFGHLKQRYPELRAKLVLVGDGPERSAVENAAIAHGVRERVVFAGQLNDVRAYYALADLMALPSLTEGSPIALLEAMAAGVPVVATRVGGVPEIVTHNESALLVNARDVVAMAHALALVLKDEPLARKLVANARATILRHHTPAANLKSRLEVYAELLPNGLTTGTAAA